MRTPRERDPSRALSTSLRVFFSVNYQPYQIYIMRRRSHRYGLFILLASFRDATSASNVTGGWPSGSGSRDGSFAQMNARYALHSHISSTRYTGANDSHLESADTGDFSTDEQSRAESKPIFLGATSTADVRRIMAIFESMCEVIFGSLCEAFATEIHSLRELVDEYYTTPVNSSRVQ